MSQPSGPPSGPANPPKVPTEDKPRTIKEAAAEIGIGYHKLRKLVAGRAVQCVVVGRTVRFFDADIAAAKAQFRVTPKSAQVVAIGRRGRAA